MENYIFDSHCHIQNSSLDVKEDTIRNELSLPDKYTIDVMNKIKTLPIGGVGMMGTTIIDSIRIGNIIDQLNESPIHVNYGVGIHPWFCENTKKNHPDWKEQLENLLKKYPEASIGECGLDKVARNRATGKNFSMPIQMEFFEYQFHLAAKYKRPIVIHSVKTVGKIFEFIKKQLNESIDNIPPKIMFHSYCGTPDITKSLLNLTSIRERFYFGFSYFVNSRITRNEDNIKLISKDRILLETDYHEIDDVPEFIQKIYEMLSSYSCLASVEDLYQLTYNNAINFFKI
ncbi:Metallo-dependent hydrolase [Anaeromyces robustus]|uniref:Metallo-dependent hydrolase n=1 Tax=Anaeromyces robustus TaxID=1754192 RepID=A0A1Y1VV89_9FUNG|nr:Metallo-dependent hydrolase [Anaeromyces robustus]|eukprot:ORX65113.1 Metallo-dependent hydrolase [Anaeromyces robustus]